MEILEVTYSTSGSPSCWTEPQTVAIVNDRCEAEAIASITDANLSADEEGHDDWNHYVRIEVLYSCTDGDILAYKNILSNMIEEWPSLSCVADKCRRGFFGNLDYVAVFAEHGYDYQKALEGYGCPTLD